MLGYKEIGIKKLKFVAKTPLIFLIFYIIQRFYLKSRKLFSALHILFKIFLKLSSKIFYNIVIFNQKRYVKKTLTSNEERKL